ncbi:IclR family transcriptional regulator [Telmatospirillum sp.]|uniref:IclR family transcriptional regulator n=1 Tax=Telmatospirillum sp. TaxID=2079197 RepID=UPI00284509F0|nr:IclR family transcriptional regulator [Telmatospirillum sp.]MDR3439390.1 IclR family transcriptional regulator [Telmatospirillum sp.]
MARQSSFAIERCMAILERLSQASNGLPLSTIGEDLDIPKSAVYRFLQVLEEQGYVRQDETRRYSLTMRVVQMGFRFLAGKGVWEIAQPILNRLAERSGELVRMTVSDGQTLSWIASAQGARSGLIIDPVMGSRVVMHATATGKVWLASLPTEEAISIVLRQGLGSPQEHGPNVIQSVEGLIKEFKLTRERGYGLNVQEAEAGVTAIAVAIKQRGPDGQEKCVGTLSIAGPTSRTPAERLEAFVPDLQAAAREISDLWLLIERTPQSERPRQLFNSDVLRTL